MVHPVKRAAGKKKFDVTARPVPIRVKGLLCACGLLGAAVIAEGINRATSGKFQPDDTTRILHLACVLLGALTSITMNDRDELEAHDGPLMIAVGVLSVMSQTALVAGLTWAGTALLPVTHLVLAARNSKGLYIAWKKKAVPFSKLSSNGITAGSGVGVLAVLTHCHVNHGYGSVVSFFMICTYMSAAAVLATAWASTFAERFPAVNSKEMFRAACLLAVAEVFRGVGYSTLRGTQVLASSFSVALWGLSLAAIGISAYRRKYKVKRDL